jgi:hypothetical protein
MKRPPEPLSQRHHGVDANISGAQLLVTGAEMAFSILEI